MPINHIVWGFFFLSIAKMRESHRVNDMTNQPDFFWLNADYVSRNKFVLVATLCTRYYLLRNVYVLIYHNKEPWQIIFHNFCKQFIPRSIQSINLHWQNSIKESVCETRTINNTHVVQYNKNFTKENWKRVSYGINPCEGEWGLSMLY
jgi:NADPH-dependent 7-cyano-7-deazaguanine reductase QueF